MNYRLLSKILGLLLILLAGAMLFCVLFELLDSELHPEGKHALRSFLLSTSITLLAGAGLVAAGRGSGREILRKEAIAIVGLGWMLSAAFGALPFIFTHHPLGFAGGFFESASGFTTTGASVIADTTIYPRSIMLWRAITQWLGGMGILVLFVAVLSYLGVGSKSLFRHESSLNISGGFHSRIRDTAVSLWRIYVGITLVCIIGLRVLGMNLFDAVIHGFAAVSTGGFSNRNESIAYYASPAIEWWLIICMTLGGASFMMYLWLLRRRWSYWKTEEETKFYLLLLGAASAVIASQLLLFGIDHSLSDAFRKSAFQVVSIMTTTGFASANYDEWPALSKGLLLALMFIGGCAGSTAGGVKVSRLILFLRIALSELVAGFRPNQIMPLKLNGRTMDESLRHQTLFLITLAVFLVAIGSLLFLLFEPGNDIVTAFSAVVACIFNIGPGLGGVGPTMNYSGLLPVTQLMLALLMILGRLEFFAILVLFMPSLWRKY